MNYLIFQPSVTHPAPPAAPARPPESAYVPRGSRESDATPTWTSAPSARSYTAAMTTPRASTSMDGEICRMLDIEPSGRWRFEGAINSER